MERYLNKIKNWLLAVAIAVGVSACGAMAPREGPLDLADETISEAIRINSEQPELPESVAEALLPSIDLYTVPAPVLDDEQRFDVAVNQVPARQFFMSLVEGTRYNMVIHPEVDGMISLNLKDVSILEVVEAVRDVYGYEIVGTSYGFQVLPGRLQARIYQIDFLNVVRSGRSASFVSAGTLTAVDGMGDGSINDGTVTAFGGATNRQVLGTQIDTLQPETSFWQELSTSLVAIVGPGDGRSVVVNPQSGAVVVRALPRELREVETFLRATQLMVQRQVILEAKILEIDLSEEFQAGINWAALVDDSALIGQTRGGKIFPDDVSDIAGQAGGLDPGDFDPIKSALASAFGGVFAVAIDIDNFKAFVELLKTQGNVQVLSSPRISTLNNQKAVIKVGQDEFFVTDISTTTITSTATTSIPNVELTPFFSGIALDVTPQISEAGYVTLHVHPAISEVVDQEKSFTIAGVEQTLPLALSTVRETDSIVRARSGQVIVIGGLMQDAINDVHAKPPVLGDVPGIGVAFRQQRKKSRKTELVILLRPIVVDSDGQQWVDALEQNSRNLRDLRNELRTREQLKIFQSEDN